VASTLSSIGLVNPLSGRGACAICTGPISAARTLCTRCRAQPNHLDAVVPITYALRGSAIYDALRSYKRGSTPEIRAAASLVLVQTLRAFLRRHIDCLAKRSDASAFDVLAPVPSSARGRKRHSPLAALITAASGVDPAEVLAPTPTPGRRFSPTRFAASGPVPRRILLIDDLWTHGGHAQSAAYALRRAGAETIALLVIGRYLRADWPIGDGRTCADAIEAAPAFTWEACAAEPVPRLALVSSSRHEPQASANADQAPNRRAA
jgi:predicted amidophosphoribosyltransferase